MAQIIALFMAFAVTAGAYESGKDLLDMVVRMAQVATEKLNLNQLGKSIMLENMSRGSKMNRSQFPEFARKAIVAGGRDPSSDIWGSPYFMEIDRWRGLQFSSADGKFVLCSAGPDKRWWNVDDELWASFFLAPEFTFRPKGDGPAAGDIAGVILSKFEKARKEMLAGLEKLTGLTGGKGEGKQQGKKGAPTGAGSTPPGRTTAVPGRSGPAGGSRGSGVR